MSTDTTEKGLEVHISQYLVDENKYALRENKAYNNVSCFDEMLLFQFLEATQPKELINRGIQVEEPYVTQ